MVEIKSPSEAHQVNVALRLLRAEAIKISFLCAWLMTKSAWQLKVSFHQRIHVRFDNNKKVSPFCRDKMFCDLSG